ncbi:glycoside hydrolase family 3 protein [Aquiflexum sp. TKW24L]|uniref:glycoside hydrolase family 3 protein n=1 Tax=Aquiflexum sp. TKW24L TaxID=2942212 RepID=UPI0020BD5F5F|nr:glycoside hydrolase family 3 N-terminal domain-containing protein [Aquiflexum sp. TKW24L]MCL6261269.1 glycoside hydrolase family 3 protein [Aquiflexum sp. TKW24L]
MKQIPIKTIALIAVTVLLLSCEKNVVEETQIDENITLLTQSKGVKLGYSKSSGVNILEKNGLKFKDLNKNGELDKYEDWRLSFEERATDLASKLSVEQIAGLMLYSSHQAIPAAPAGFGAGTYEGKPFPESGMPSSSLSDQQKKFLTEDNLRHVLITRVESPEVAAQWNNNAQAYVEGLGLGIPTNNSSDPRHSPIASTEYNAGAGGNISMWPEALGLAATFDPALVQRFGEVASIEYRALGVTTALSPQIDLGTEPRWNRLKGTFGEDSRLSADMARGYVDGFQTSAPEFEISNGWGFQSVNAMVKHWPSGGPEEGGRDGHFAYGKFAVYPGNNFEEHLVPFTEGAFKLSGKTKSASAVMPYYTISYGQDSKNGENVANAYSEYLITDLLRGKYGYEGVVCTDWGVTGNERDNVEVFAGKPWGMETASIAERHYRVIMAGADQFGGNNDIKPVLEAYQLGVKEHGEEWMRARFEKSAVRLLRNIFQAGLFENPYLEIAHTKETVGNSAYMEEGFQAQVKSIVMLKNKENVLPLAKNSKVYIPKKFIPSTTNWFGVKTEEKWVDAINLEIAKKYFQVTENPNEADFALVFISNPESGTGYDPADRMSGGNGYVPISLQYGTYTAATAREQSIAAGDPVLAPQVTNRSYKNKTITASNLKDLQNIMDTKKAMNGKPVVTIISVSNPMVFSEFEKEVQGIVLHFNVQDQAILDILSGTAEPSGLLPVQMPANMETVESQFEDVAHDMDCHVDEAGNTYDFAFGLNWKGVIKDSRTEKYQKK